ncbi:MAG: T9SS type A sorting domain-containing protein [Ignavibacteriales bacterium]|nr:T9SS type A sorting domain-containing protein [Ignavibacteriales bacterium]
MKKVFISMFFLLFTFSYLNSQVPYIWHIYKNLKFPVAGGQIVVRDSTVYIFGGYSDSTQSYVDWIQKYDPIGKDWSIVAKMKNVRYGLVADIYQEQVFYYGDVEYPDFGLFGLEKWNFDPLIYPSTHNYNINFDRVFSTGNIYNGKFYIIGGDSYFVEDSLLNYIVEYDIATSTVTFKSNFTFNPSNKPFRQMSAMLGDDIYIFGGVITGISKNIYKFNTTEHTLELLPIQLLKARASGNAVAISENEIMIIGGFDESGKKIGPTEIFVKSDTGYQIKPGPSINISRSESMAFIIGKNLYIAGGRDDDGNIVEETEMFILESTTDIEQDKNSTITNFELSQNYPNPFNPSTAIKFSLPEASVVKLSVYNILGEQVALLKNEQMNAGLHSVEFNASHLSSGIYLYRLEADKFTETKKMILLK